MALDSVYTSSRYPSDIGMIESGKPSQQDAREFYESAKNIFDSIIKLID
jgi:HEPN domain-containing protein